MKPKALLLLSAGLDSSAAAVIAQRTGVEVVTSVTFDYGQRSASSEKRQAAAIAELLGCKHRVVRLPWFSELSSGGALLTDTGPLPEPSLDKLDTESFTRASAKAVWVPNRNGVFLSIGACLAEGDGLDRIIVGFNKEEAQTFPDNSVEFLNVMNGALRFSTANGVQIISPTATLTKAAIVDELKSPPFPFRLLWSCYQPGEVMCGRCESCMRLKRALFQNGVDTHALFVHTGL